MHAQTFAVLMRLNCHRSTAININYAEEMAKKRVLSRSLIKSRCAAKRAMTKQGNIAQTRFFSDLQLCEKVNLRAYALPSLGCSISKRILCNLLICIPSWWHIHIRLCRCCCYSAPSCVSDLFKINSACVHILEKSNASQFMFSFKLLAMLMCVCAPMHSASVQRNACVADILHTPDTRTRCECRAKCTHAYIHFALRFFLLLLSFFMKIPKRAYSGRRAELACVRQIARIRNLFESNKQKYK